MVDKISEWVSAYFTLKENQAKLREPYKSVVEAIDAELAGLEKIGETK